MLSQEELEIELKLYRNRNTQLISILNNMIFYSTEFEDMMEQWNREDEERLKQRRKARREQKQQEAADDR